MDDDYLTKLQSYRDQIDAIDDEMLNLLARRSAQVLGVAELKAEHDSSGGSFYRPDREARILRRLVEKNPGPLSGEAILSIFREVISQSMALEERLKIAYLGPEGTFSEQMAIGHFGTAPQFYPLPTFDEIFRATVHGTVDWAIVPIENSIEGPVSRVLDCLMEHDVQICAEATLPIWQNLLCLNTDLSQVKVVYGHQQSLSQCHRWLNANLPHVERIPVSSNGEAARLASFDETVCAVAGDIAQTRYPTLNLCYRHIEDEPDNTTRFIVIGHKDAAPTGKDKTSLLVGIENRVGSMFDMIEPIRRHGISMSRIESRPAKRGMRGSVWEYVFFIDLLGHREDPSVANALADLKASAGFVRVLGSYPVSGAEDG